MNKLMPILAIAIGAAIGANLRYAVSLWAVGRFGTSFPYGTLIVNLVGSFVIGLVLAFGSLRPLNDTVRLVLVTGLLGGFTTFSSFSYEAYSLLIAGNWGLALLYCLASVLIGLIGVALAFSLVQRLLAGG